MLKPVRRRTKTLPIAVLGLLLVVNAVLLVLVLSNRSITGQPASAVSTTQAAPPISQLPSTALTPQPKSSSSETTTSSTEPTKLARGERLLLATSPRSAWRATVGDCSTAGTVERSTDAGKSWRRVVKSRLAPIVALGSESGEDFYAIGGTGKNCSTRYVFYDRDGTPTASTNNPMGLWYPTPNDRDEVNGPGNNKSRPCKDQIVGLAADSSSALVACADGAVMIARGGGKEWREFISEAQPLALASTGNGRYWLATRSDDCDGIAVRHLVITNSDFTRGPKRCAPALDIGAGEVALDVHGSTVWLWAGSKVHLSIDSGRTWS